ncbi:MAG: hypothetical protein GEV28_20745 [Actinophytocola sp.]|uniref:anti-sigma factor family protein n=1 Tax=Actinophytocola sp. TaxID=1872138 RepID=UPI001321F109|nr:zf-HC2 domain-containing protein [Actinophytocola sp.]MPZ82693.1 hypothetical protein [Actinophytocola sp.]
MSTTDDTGNGGSGARHDQVRDLLGAYLLGGLSPQDTRLMDSHLAECDECLAELTAHTPVAELLRHKAPPSAAAEPQGRLEQLLAQVRTERRARWTRRGAGVLAAAASVTLLAGIGVGILIGGNADAGDGGDMSVAFSPAAAGVETVGDATFRQKPWGTEVSVSLSEMPADGPFTLRVYGVRGHVEQAATWGPTPNDTVRVTGAVSMPIAMVDSVTVTDRHGNAITTADLPG